MKTTHLIVASVAMALCGYVAAKPYLTIDAIKTGFINNDSVKLSEHIDYPALRQNLKDQISTTMMQQVAESSKDNPMATFATGIATMMVDKVIESMITPGGMASIISGKSKDDNDKPDHQQMFKNARFTYDSIDHFSVWIPVKDSNDARLVLQRNGIDWKLVNIIIPQI